MIRNQRRTISAEDDDIVTDITSSTSVVNQTPTINVNRDVLINIQQRNFWLEDLNTRITNKTITIPLSEYVTRIYLEDNYYNKTKINEFIENFGVKIVVLQSKSELPKQGEPKYANSSYIFFVRHEHMAGSNDDRDIYDEYIWDSETEQYERIGNTDIDLSPYMTIVSFNDWKTQTYEVFVTTVNNKIRALETNKADITYVNNKIISEEEALVNAITDEFNNAMLTINSNNIATFMQLIEGLNSSIDDSIEEHNVDNTSHVDIRELPEETTDDFMSKLIQKLIE